MKLKSYNIEFSEFIEPDIGNELTAIAFLETENSRKLTKKYDLAKE
jgi:hypothetical protein